MKIFLTYLVLNSPQDTGYNYGLGYIAAILKKGGYLVSYIVLRNQADIDKFYGRVKEEQPSIIAFSVTTSQFVYLKNIAGETRKISDSFLLCGGVHPSLDPGCLKEVPELNAIVRGEGEYPMLELANAIRDKADYSKIKNFWFRDKDKIIANDIRPLLENLDLLPAPDKDSLDYQQVINQARGTNRFIFSRGCPFGCTYCSNKALSELYTNPQRYFRQISPAKAIAYIKEDQQKFKFSSIVFDDDTISLNKKWFYDFFNSFKQNFDYPFRCNLRVGTVDEDMIKLLKEAGAIDIGIGIEHGNENFRKTVLKRNITNQQIIDLFKLCDKYGLTHRDFIMVGLPYENKELFLDTVRLCRQVSAKGNASIFQPYPMTALGELCRRENWLPRRDYYQERKEAVISYPGFSGEEIQLCHDVFPYLLRFKFIPLFIPLSWIKYGVTTMKTIKNKIKIKL